MKTFEKEAHFPSQHNIFLSKKNEAEEKNYELLLPYRFFPVFLEKNWKYNNERQKISRLRNSIAKEFVGFLFRKKESTTEEEQEHCEKNQQIMFKGAMEQLGHWELPTIWKVWDLEAELREVIFESLVWLHK